MPGQFPGHRRLDASIKGSQATTLGNGQGQEVEIGNLAMPRQKRQGHQCSLNVQVSGPEYMTGQFLEASEDSQNRRSRFRLPDYLWIERNPHKACFSDRAGRKAFISMGKKPSCCRFVAEVVWPGEADEEVYIEKCDAHASSSAAATSSGPKGGADSATANTGSPDSDCADSAARSPFRASSETTLPRPSWRAFASPWAARYTSSAKASVVRIPTS